MKVCTQRTRDLDDLIDDPNGFESLVNDHEWAILSQDEHSEETLAAKKHQQWIQKQPELGGHKPHKPKKDKKKSKDEKVAAREKTKAAREAAKAAAASKSDDDDEYDDEYGDYGDEYDDEEDAAAAVLNKQAESEVAPKPGQKAKHDNQIFSAFN